MKDYKNARVPLVSLIVLLAMPIMSNAAISERDVAVAANQVASIETFKLMVAAHELPKDAIVYGEGNYGPGLARLYAQYDSQGEGPAFRRAVAKATAPQVAALRRVFPSGQRPAGFSVDIPLPSIVTASVQGSDEVDTAARRKAALEIVRTTVQAFGHGKDLLAQPPDIAAWLRVYMAAETEVQGRQEQRFAKDPCTGKNCDRHRFFTAGYARDAKFQREVLTRHFSSEVANVYVQAKAEERAAIEASKHEQPSRLRKKTRSGLSVAGTWLGLLGGLLVVVLLIEGFRRKQAKPPPPPLSENYGSAAFAPASQELPHPQAFSQGAFLGKSSAQGDGKPPPLTAPLAPIFTTPEHHTLIVARTRTGKGTRVIVPTLLSYEGSALVIDPKGENAAITGRARKNRLGQTVQVVNPWNELAQQFGRLELGVATYNPLDVLDRDDPNAVAIAQALASAICPATEGGKDGFWQGSAANVLAAVLLWITDRPEEQKTLGRMREIVTRSRADFFKNYLAKMATSSAFHGGISEMVGQYLDLAPETYSGIMTHLAEATKFLSDPQVKASTAASSFKMEHLIMERMTVYLVIPPERMDTQKTWLRLVLTSAMHTIKKHRFAEGRRGRCMFLVDEFAALGRMEDIPRDIATMSGYGLDMTLIVQGIDQLKASYGESADTILNNCAYKWFCNISDLSTAKYVSESLGNKTVRTTGVSHSENQNESGGSEGESTSYGETGRPLMRHEEILTLGRDFAVVFQPQGQPLFLQPVDYWNLTRAFDHMKGFHPRMYWEPPLQFDPNPYVQGADGKQQRKQKTDAPVSTGMSEAEAREILEVSPTASRAEILTAYKRLMGKVHPDRGGSNFFAKQLNAARAVLLEE